MKKIYLLSGLLLVMMLFILTGCSKENEQVTEEKNINFENENVSDIDSLGDMEVDKGVFNVEITVPSEYVGEKTQEELTALAEENGYKSVTLNEDGSATYIMSKSQHKKMMDELKESFDTSLQEMLQSEEYPSITDIKHNDDYTDFTVTTSHTELDLAESFSTMVFYMYGGMYAAFNDSDVDNVHVSFINSVTGEIISEANSKDLAE